SLSIPLSAQKRADDLISKLDIPTSKHLAGFHAGSAPNFLWKRWPRKYWVELGQLLIEKNYHVLIFGGPDEIKLKRKLHARLNKDSTVVESDLITTAAVMQKCELFVSNDSGLMHIAAATGVKTFGLFGPTDERQTGPRGEQSFVIRAPGTEPVYHTEKNFDLGNKPHETLRALEPAYVFERIFS
ncbi:MAG: glycosyltransferase family 9 protein, partial [Patescibacteria group bacterium]